MKLGSWLDERIGHRAWLSRMLRHPVVGGPRWGRVLGSALLFLVVLEAVTGALLLTAYSPSTTTAWASVRHIDYAVSSGWVVRGLHHFGAHATVAIVILHLLKVAIDRAYTQKREVNWWVGLALMGLVVGFVITGNLLPWDQDGYWGAQTETSIMGTVPGAGTTLQRLLVGGSDYGHLTLARFFSLHVAVLPGLLVLFVLFHVGLARRHARLVADADPPGRVTPYFPGQAGRDMLFALVVLGACFALTFALAGAPLDAPADPTSEYPARPEWYFVALSQLLELLGGKLQIVGAVGAPTLLGGYLFLLPLFDGRRTASAVRRALVFLPLALAFLGAVALASMRFKADRADEEYLTARKAADARRDRAILLAGRGVPPAGPLEMLANDSETRGGDLYREHCVTCHKLGELAPPDDEEAKGPDLSGFGTEAWADRVLVDPDGLFGHTAFEGKMPSVVTPPKDPEGAAAFTPMKDEDRAAIVAFLVAEADGKGGAGMAGERLVKDRCTSCHRLDGDTTDDESPAPELRGWASRDWIEAQILDPGSGRAYPPAAMDEALEGHMPAFADKISPKDVKLLTRWVVRHTRATSLPERP